MTVTTEYFMQSSRHVLADRLADFLNARFPGPGRDKRLARLIGCTPATARNYFDRIWPSARAWRAIVREFGRDVIAAVFDPEIDDVAARLDSEIRALEEALESKRAHRRSLQGVAEGEARQ